MTETKNLKLKTYETTTDGQELVARYIDNTSDNFQKIDEFCKTDTTLSVEGGIADAKTVGDNVSQLKDDLADIRTKEVISPINKFDKYAAEDGFIAVDGATYGYSGYYHFDLDVERGDIINFYVGVVPTLVNARVITAYD